MRKSQWTVLLCGVLMSSAIGCIGTEEDARELDALAHEDVGVVSEALNVRFRNCDSTQLSKAQAAANRANVILTERRSDSQFTKFFGVVPSNSAWSLYHTIVNNVSVAARQKLDDPSITIDCRGGRNSSMAHTTSALTTIFLDIPFFAANASLNGRDGQAGTIVHELTHLTGLTTDIAIPPGGGSDYFLWARELAQTSPSRALNNAYNHEYYWENQ